MQSENANLNRIFVSSLLILLVLLPCAAYAQERPAYPEERLFNQAEYRAHLKFLAHDLVEGRAVGTRGGELAALYIAAQFEAAGLQPISDEDGYYQRVPMFGNATEQESVQFGFTAGGRQFEYVPLEEVIVNSETDSEQVELEGSLLFVGYGIEAPEYEWDDYKGVDTEGRVLVMFTNDPDPEKTGFADESMTYYARWTYKEEIARAKKASGLILLHTDETATYSFAVVQGSWSGERVRFGGQIDNPLAVKGWITQPAADRALEAAGYSVARLKEMADDRDFRPVELGVTLNASLRQRCRSFSSPNVIGLLPGASMSDEAVVFTGHYDHFGIGRPVDGDAIYNGAFDNASGTSAIICLARAFAAGPPPARTLVFFANTGEESGLLGSGYYAANPVFPLEKTAVVFNMDVFSLAGEMDGFGAFPIQYTDSEQVVSNIGRSIGLELHVRRVDRGGFTFRSDHFPFLARGAVALSVGLSGNIKGMEAEEAREFRQRVFGGRYHQPSDEVHPEWRYDGSVQQLRLLYRLGRHWADGAPAARLTGDNPLRGAIRLRTNR